MTPESKGAARAAAAATPDARGDREAIPAARSASDALRAARRRVDAIVANGGEIPPFAAERGRKSENQQWKLRIQEEGRRRTVEKRIF